mmetsp:Transcript_5390/g.11978  ORF Transcript_5390/g.11978 Transcript_5390/m.11978 type:complete len:148 (-) Transcript_5390:1650-2093(-)
MLYNPFYMLEQCLGPDLCVKFCCVFIVLICVVATIFLFPQVSGFTSFISSLGTLGYVLVGLLVAAILAACCWCAIDNHLRTQREQEEINKSYEIEAQLMDAERGEYIPAEDTESDTRCCACCYGNRKAEDRAQVENGTAEEVEMLRL